MKKKCGLSCQRSVQVTLVTCVYRFLESHIVDPEMVGSYESDCSSCVTASQAHLPSLKRKLKVHLLLHLCQSMLQCGPTSAYNMKSEKSIHQPGTRMYVSVQCDIFSLALLHTVINNSLGTWYH